MKSIFLICLYVAMVGPLLAQTPSGLHYQGIARNAQGAPLANTAISIKLSIKDAATGGTVLYTETKNVTTNSFGLYSTVINDGTGTKTGDFSSVNWSAGARFLKTEIDPANGSSFVDMGTQPFNYVPLALVADNLKGVSQPKEGEILEFQNGTWTSKPGTKRYRIIGSGLNPGQSLNFIGPTAIITIEKNNPKMTISISKALGSTVSNGAVGLLLSLGFKRGNGPVTYFDPGYFISSIRVASGTRVPMTLSGSFNTEFLEGESVEVGIVGFAAGGPSQWNDNGGGLGYVELSY